MQSKFFNVDDWETVDVSSTAIGMEAGMVDPVSSIGFSIFMSGEAGTPAGKDTGKGNENDNDNDIMLSGQPSSLAGSSTPNRSKDAFAKNIFIGMEPPKPSWVRENY